MLKIFLLIAAFRLASANPAVIAVKAEPTSLGTLPTTAINNENLILKPPPPPNLNPEDPELPPTNKACGLELPTTESWTKDLPKISTWANQTFTHYLQSTRYNSFPNYMRSSPGSIA